MENEIGKARTIGKDSRLFWNAEDVVRQLGVSKPTAYRLMHESGAMASVPRRCLVYRPAFIDFIMKSKRNGGEQ